ncbi:MAG TPA: hypothetical protein DDZ67_08380 [Xanthomonadaceae bacterium]|nr:hypothetical protein [Xanthomonadaceae bacterium]
MPHPLFAIPILGIGLAVHGAAAAEDIRCDVESPYELTLNDRSLILIREGAPQRIVMRQGRMFVDDRWVELSAEDSARLVRFERQTRDIIPLAQDVGRQAADIALTALGEVAAGFSRDPARTRKDLDEIRARVDVGLRQSFKSGKFTEIDIDDRIGGLVAEVLPGLIGDAVAGAVQAALTGREPTLNSLDGLDERVEKLVEPQARKLRPQAEKLCRRMQELDEIDNALAYRLPGGQPLDLLHVQLKPGDAKSE